MKDNMKRVLSALLTVSMAFSTMSAVVFANEDVTTLAETLVENKLKDSHKNIYAQDNFQSIEDLELRNPLNLKVDLDDPYADFSYWHFVDSSKTSQKATISFYDNNDKLVTWDVSPSGKTHANDPDKNQHYAVITPSGWKLADGVSYALEGGQFNLSHSGRHIAKLTKVNVEASVKPFYYEITPHKVYERNVDKFYERTVDEFYERTVDTFYERTIDEYYERTVDKFYERSVDEFYERDVTKFYERPVTDVYQRYAQKYLIPVFEKKLEGNYNGTLVTRLNYSDNTVNAVPTNGKAFKNGHTCVEVNVADASTEEGIWFTIADSSKNNGKKTPDRYNVPINYQYNVKIRDGKLTVSCGDDLAFASVGAYVYAKAPKDAKNAPSHHPGSVTVDLPKDSGDVVYLYAHFERLGWYEVDENGNFVYQFKEWRYDDSRTEYDENYTLIDTIEGDYAYVETKYGEYELVDTVYGDYQLIKTEYGEYELVNTVKGDYKLVDTQYGEYEYVRTEYGKYKLEDTKYGDYELVSSYNTAQIFDAVYTGTLTLTVNGEVKPLNEEFDLAPGTYTFTITGSDDKFAPVSKEVTILPGPNQTVVFEPIVYHEEDVVLATVEHFKDRDATPHYADKPKELHKSDKAATPHYKDLEATVHKSDKEAVCHYADKAAETHHSDREAESIFTDKHTDPIYNNDYLFKDDIKLGSEDDPFGEYAVRLN